jgi:hypothetical protein
MLKCFVCAIDCKKPCKYISYKIIRLNQKHDSINGVMLKLKSNIKGGGEEHPSLTYVAQQTMTSLTALTCEFGYT